MIVSVKHTFVYVLIIVELTTCFDLASSSSDLYKNQVMLKKTAYIFGIPKMYAVFFNITWFT